MRKQLRFDMLAVGERFTCDLLGSPDREDVFQKTSTRKAAPAVENSGPRMDMQFAMKPTTVVTVEVADV